MMNPAYLIETSMISAQKMSDEIPYTPATVGWAASACCVKIACSV
jgi:hypothetical protein